MYGVISRASGWTDVTVWAARERSPTHVAATMDIVGFVTHFASGTTVLGT